jgi:hypothetical protein
LHRHIALEGRQVAAIVEQKQVAGSAQVDGLPQLRLEAVEHRQAEQREPDVDFGAELIANATGAFARGFAAEKLRLLQEDDIAAAATRQVIGGAGTHDSAADDDDVCGFG